MLLCTQLPTPSKPPFQIFCSTLPKTTTKKTFFSPPPAPTAKCSNYGWPNIIPNNIQSKPPSQIFPLCLTTLPLIPTSPDPQHCLKISPDLNHPLLDTLFSPAHMDMDSPQQQDMGISLNIHPSDLLAPTTDKWASAFMMMTIMLVVALPMKDAKANK